uniref:BZIP domain-containing protein n=1 Tax=Strongyloides papillosus TaxID=174720 RepID=A0A0N5C1B2_STREA
MKSITVAVVFILFTILLTTESLAIKGDLIYNNKESSLSVVLNDDVNDIQKRQNARRRARQRRARQRRQQINNLQASINNLQSQLSNLQSAVLSRFASVSQSMAG